MTGLRACPPASRPAGGSQERPDRLLGAMALVLACALVVNSALGPWGADLLAYPVPDSLRNQLLGIQLGEIEDPHNWMWKVC